MYLGQKYFDPKLFLHSQHQKQQILVLTKYYSSFANWGIGLEDCSQHSATTAK